MACSLPHTDSGVEDKGRQDVLLNLAFQFEDSCAVRDDLRKAYEKCNDISQESRALICTFLKESSEKDRRLHLFMYGKAAQLEEQIDANCPLTEKELHQLRMDEEALKEMLDEEAMNKKAQEEKIRQEQAKNDAFFLEFGVVRAYCATRHCGDWRGSFLEKVAFAARLFSASSALICNMEISFSAAARESCNSDIRSSLSSASAWNVSISTSMSSGLAVTSSGLLSGVSDAGLPLEKVVASGSRPVAGVKVNYSSGNWVTREVGESSLLGMECPVVASCSGKLSGMSLESD
ncbi:hypothetical protein Tco_0534068 [Tanacetum coccineum]